MTTIDPRFTDIEPMTCESPTAGAEPSLLYILNHFYTSHGIDAKTAYTFAVEYIAEWIKMEMSNGHS